MLGEITNYGKKLTTTYFGSANDDELIKNENMSVNQ